MSFWDFSGEEVGLGSAFGEAFSRRRDVNVVRFKHLIEFL